MTILPRFWLLVTASFAFIGGLYAVQRNAPLPFREYEGVEYRIGEIPIPPDAHVRSEWTFARLMFPGGANDGYIGRYDDRGEYEGNWREGLALWTQDFPRADRHFALAVRRLTRIDAHSVEQSVNLDAGDEVYNYPWLYAVQVGEWGISNAQAAKLRDYLLRGGFFMADDLHGTVEWSVFQESMHRVFPDRPIVEIPDGDALFHTAYDLEERYQVVGYEHLREGHKLDGYVAHWRGIYDDKGRVMVAISVNSDIGDSWEYADDPRYPEKFSALGMRIGINYIVYAMTH